MWGDETIALAEATEVKQAGKSADEAIDRELAPDQKRKKRKTRKTRKKNGS